MPNYAVIDTTQTPQVVINVISWDGVSPYDVHAGHDTEDGLILVQSDTAGRSHIYNGDGTFTNPNQEI